MSHQNLHCTIKEYRQRKGLSQDELASLVGLRRQAIYDIESGRYLPNTGVAIRLAQVLGCTVEMLFVEKSAGEIIEIQLQGEQSLAPTRLTIAQVRDKFIGIPLHGKNIMPFNLQAANGLLRADRKVDLQIPATALQKTILILGCDPALTILDNQLAKIAPGIHAHTVFASSRQALQTLAGGAAHVASTHFNNVNLTDSTDANLEAVRLIIPNLDCLVIGFALQEEGLMVAAGNPLAIGDVTDLINKKVRIVNREEGSALRKLLDLHLLQQNIQTTMINGYTKEVHSHCEGAFHVVCNTVDAALGLRVVAESFGLDFVPLAVTRSDLVIPKDLCDHSCVSILLNILQSSSLQKELQMLPGYDTSLTGKIIYK